VKPKEFIEQAKRELPTRLQTDGQFIPIGKYIGWEMFCRQHIKTDENDPRSGYLWIALNHETMRRIEGYVPISTNLTPHQNEGALFGDIFNHIKQQYNVR
jgi:hypothetical protein